VERSPGHKDPAKLRAFIVAAQAGAGDDDREDGPEGFDEDEDDDGEGRDAPFDWQEEGA
jgi:hypothetical protein